MFENSVYGSEFAFYSGCVKFKKQGFGSENKKIRNNMLDPIMDKFPQ